MENMVGKLLSELIIVNKSIDCYQDGLGKKLFSRKAYNLHKDKYRSITRETGDYVEISGFNYGWFKKSDLILNYNKNIEPNYEIY